jgi:hypothetical protein
MAVVGGETPDTVDGAVVTVAPAPEDVLVDGVLLKDVAELSLICCDAHQPPAERTAKTATIASIGLIRQPAGFVRTELRGSWDIRSEMRPPVSGGPERNGSNGAGSDRPVFDPAAP